MKKALGTTSNRQGTEILARTLYKELRSNGCDPNEVLAICTEMIDEVTTELANPDVAVAETAARAS
ncbi:MAG: hypothetical protein AB2A00_08720 [Myxococcota bacterium]